MTTLLIDGDITLYRVASKNQFEMDGEKYFGLENALKELNAEITEILRVTGFTDYLFCISSKTNYRKTLFPTYKQNRKPQDKPIGLSLLREHCFSEECWHPVKMVEDLEADDVMGILSTRNNNRDYVIYSLDKDMKTIPTRVWDFRSGKINDISKLDANKYLYKQILTGDAVDGYTGCPSIGKAKAGKLIDDCKSEYYMFIQLVRTYRKKYKDSSFQEVLDLIAYQAGQARILHAEDYDFKTKQVKIWYPWRDFGNIKKRT